MEGAKGAVAPPPTGPGLDPEILTNPMRNVNPCWGDGKD